MSDDITRLGSEAEYILSSEAFRLASEALEKKLVADWAAGAFATAEQREEAFNRVRGARVFRDSLQALLDNMKVSKAQAEERARRRAASGRKDTE